MRLLGASQISTRKFFALWAWGWLAQTTFGSVLAAALISLGFVLGNTSTFIFLILNLVTASGVLPLELMPSFFQISLGLPMYNAAQVRALVT